MERTPSGRSTRPSITDVAASAGVSKGAVSKVIRNAYGVSPSMRDRVQAAIDELGYRPRTSARVMRGASFTLGLEMPQIGNDFFTLIMQGATDQLGGSGYQLIVAPGSSDMKGAAVLDALTDRQVDGIIAISPEVSPEWLEQLGQQVPTVAVGRHDHSSSYDTLTNDDRRGAEMAMSHLIELGHQKITHLTVSSPENVPEGLLPHTIRRQTYETAMDTAGLSPKVVLTRPFEQAAFEAAMTAMASPLPPTAIFAANDTLAIGAMRARAELGLDARKLSVVGYDNVDLAANPLISLTTVDQFGLETGRRAVSLLMERIKDHRTAPAHVQVTPKLRVRNSTRTAISFSAVPAPSDVAVRVTTR